MESGQRGRQGSSIAGGGMKYQAQRTQLPRANGVPICLYEVLLHAERRGSSLLRAGGRHTSRPASLIRVSRSWTGCGCVRCSMSSRPHPTESKNREFCTSP